jgi:hypothetical protein
VRQEVPSLMSTWARGSKGNIYIFVYILIKTISAEVYILRERSMDKKCLAN